MGYAYESFLSVQAATCSRRLEEASAAAPAWRPLSLRPLLPQVVGLTCTNETGGLDETNHSCLVLQPGNCSRLG